VGAAYQRATAQGELRDHDNHDHHHDNDHQPDGYHQSDLADLADFANGDDSHDDGGGSRRFRAAATDDGDGDADSGDPDYGGARSTTGDDGSAELVGTFPPATLASRDDLP
jgi:hypothetical protein